MEFINTIKNENLTMKFKDYLIESEYVKKGNQIVPKDGWYVKIGRKTTYKNDYQLVKNITEFKDFLDTNFHGFNYNDLLNTVYTQTNDIYDVGFVEVKSLGKVLFTAVSVSQSIKLLTRERK